MVVTKTERDLVVRLARSTGGVVHVDPIPDPGAANDESNDGVATLFDCHGVIDDSKDDGEKMNYITKWIGYHISMQLQAIIQNNPRVRARLRLRFKNNNLLKTDNDFKRLIVSLVAEKSTPPDCRKYWFLIGTVPA